MPEPHDIEIRKNVEFGVHDDDILTGDYYAPRGAGPYPALIALHGGAGNGERQKATSTGDRIWPSTAMCCFPLTIAWYRVPRTVIRRQSMIPALPCNFCGAKRRHSRWIPTGSGALGTPQAPISQRSWRSQVTAPPFCAAYPSDPYAGVEYESQSGRRCLWCRMTCWPNGSMIK